MIAHELRFLIIHQELRKVTSCIRIHITFRLEDRAGLGYNEGQRDEDRDEVMMRAMYGDNMVRLQVCNNKRGGRNGELVRQQRQQQQQK